MPVPARRHSRSHVRRRRSHDALKPSNVGLCVTCQATLLPHRACTNCGTYKGKQVIDTSREVARAAKSQLKPGSGSMGKAAASTREHDHDHDHKQTIPKSKKEKAS